MEFIEIELFNEELGIEGCCFQKLERYLEIAEGKLKT
jgi:hypothetical protein